MAVKKEKTYVDLTPARPLDKKTLNKMVWRSMNLQASFNYERMQAGGWLWAMMPGLEKFHTNKDDLSTSMKHNLEFFHTNPFMVTFVMGLVLSMEEEKSSFKSIRSARTAAMSAAGGIGDALIWFTLMPVVAGITAGMAVNGNPAGPVIYFVVLFAIQMALRFFGMYWSYDAGMRALDEVDVHAKNFTHAASVLGVFMAGALTLCYGTTKLGMTIQADSVIDLQEKLNGILPGLIPLAFTMLCWHLMKHRKWSLTKCVVLMLIIGFAGCAFGIWAGKYQSLIPVPWHA